MNDNDALRELLDNVSPDVLAVNPELTGYKAARGVLPYGGESTDAILDRARGDYGKPSKKPKETEVAFQSWLIDYAKLKGWKVAHFRGGWSKDGKRFNTPIQGDKGFFDVPLARNGVVLLIEVKSDIGRLSPEQKEWLAAAGSHGFVARPRDREMIEKLLS